MWYQFKMLYVPGKLLATADTLPQAPCDQVQPQEIDSVETFISDVLKRLPSNVASQIEGICQHQYQDDECTAVMGYCLNGWPNQRKLPATLTAHCKEQGQLSVCDGLLLLDY